MLNFKKKTLDKKELDIKNKYTPIKFENHIKIKTLEDIFNVLFNLHRENATFLEDGTLDCNYNKGRSYYDAYRLCMHYLPEMTFFKMYTKLRNYVRLGNPDLKSQWPDYYSSITSSFITCPTIGRARFAGSLKFK
tara:strand:+ start:1516 stop:1920 length:405 start_codon:yes stop_codon:yes gene_type:complete